MKGSQTTISLQTAISVVALFFGFGNGIIEWLYYVKRKRNQVKKPQLPYEWRNKNARFPH